MQPAITNNTLEKRVKFVAVYQFSFRLGHDRPQADAIQRAAGTSVMQAGLAPFRQLPFRLAYAWRKLWRDWISARTM
jgi:hypothetical protein